MHRELGMVAHNCKPSIRGLRHKSCWIRGHSEQQVWGTMKTQSQETSSGAPKVHFRKSFLKMFLSELQLHHSPSSLYSIQAFLALLPSNSLCHPHTLSGWELLLKLWSHAHTCKDMHNYIKCNLMSLFWLHGFRAEQSALENQWGGSPMGKADSPPRCH